MRVFGSLVLAMFCAAGVWAQQYTETSGGQKIIGTGDNNTTYYYGSFAYGETGQVYMYVQGDANLADQTYHDQILLYSHPNTWTGLTTPFSYVKRLLPTSGFPNPDFYGGPSVFTYGGT